MPWPYASTFHYAAGVRPPPSAPMQNNVRLPSCEPRMSSTSARIRISATASLLTLQSAHLVVYLSRRLTDGVCMPRRRVFRAAASDDADAIMRSPTTSKNLDANIGRNNAACARMTASCASTVEPLRRASRKSVVGTACHCARTPRSRQTSSSPASSPKRKAKLAPTRQRVLR